MPSPSDRRDQAIPRYVSLLWDREDPAPRRGPRPTLTIRDIGTAAAAIADEQGLDAVSMKAIATRLGLTTMSLYRYVDSKDDVIDVMLDTAIGRPAAGLTESGSWRERITAWALAMAHVLRERPWLAAVGMSRPPVGPNTMAWTDAGVRAFEDTGISAPKKMSALLLVDGFVRQHVRLASQMDMLGDTSGDHSYETTVAALIDPESYPSLAEAVAAPEFATDDDFFPTQLDFGLTVILDGIAALIDRT